MSASGAELRRPGIVFCFAVLLAARFSHSAPVYDQDTTQVAEYNGGGNTCYYNYKHYQEGDRIITNEPCLNCTCHDRMLMCYLRVCPFTKAIGQDCTVEKRPDQCCPVITCPQVPVQLLTSTTSSPSSESTELGFRDNYGCNVNNLFYADGAQLPIDYHNPCELCYCIRNRTTCVMQECTLKVAGCKPIFQPGVCCPVKYDCDYDERTETTIGPTTPGLLMTTTIAPGIAAECYYEGKAYEDGELIYSTKPCQHCYCFRGEIACAIQDCGTPMKTHGKNCTALPPPEGECCPTTYQCESDFDNEVTSMPETTDGIFSSSEKPMSTLLPSKESETKPPISDESYPGADNTIPELQPVDELTTMTQENDQAITMSSERPEKTTQLVPSSEKPVEEMTDVPQFEDRENIPEKNKEEEVTEEVESSTRSEEEKLTTLLTDEVPVAKEETSTVKDTFESSTSSLLPTEKEESNYTEKPDFSESNFPTEIPETEKSTEISLTEKTEEIPVTEKSTEIPVTERIEEIPETEKSTEIPVTEKTEEITITEKTEEIPVTEKSTEIPVTERIEEIPETEKLTEIPVTEKTEEIPVTEKSTEIPVTERIEEIPETEKSTEIPETEKSTEISLTEKSTEIATSSEKPFSSEAPETGVGIGKTESPVTTISLEDSTSELPGDSIDEGSKTSESENEIPKETIDTSSEMGITSSSSTEEDQSQDETTPSMFSTESNLYSTTKQDAELTTKVEKEEISTRQPVTIPISDRMPEHKAEDKDAISEMPMTEPSDETEMTPDITVTYLPPVSTTEKEQAATTESFVETTGFSKESEPTLKPEFHETDLTTIQSDEVGDTDHSSVSVPMSTEHIPEKESTESTVTEHEVNIKEMKTTHMLSSFESTDGMLASTPGIGAETTEEPSKTPKLELTTVTEFNPSEEETSQTSESYTTKGELDVDINTTKPSESVTVEESQTESATKSTFTDAGSTLSTEITGVDRAITTEVSEEHSDKPETTAVPITQKSTDEKETEKPSTDVLMTEEPFDEISSVETSSESAVDETSTPILSEIETSTKIEYSTQGSTEMPDIKTETVQTDMITSGLTSDLPIESTTETEEQLSTSMKPTDEPKKEISEALPEDKIEVTADTSEISSPETSTISQSQKTNAPELEDRLGNTEQSPESKTEEEVIKEVTISQQEKTPKPAMEGETLMPHVPKKEESDVGMSQIPDVITPEMTPSTEVESSHTTESLQTDGTPVVPPEMRPPIGIPGEGNCLVDGQSYSNNSAIPPANSCQIRCRCVSSIVQCDLVQCAPPPSDREDCTPIHTSTECCPTYSCEKMPEIESDNHMIDHETPKPDMETVMPEVEKTTLKTVDEHSLVTSSPGSTETEYDQSLVTEVTKLEELDKSTTIQEESSKPTASSTESMVLSSTTTTKPEEHDTSESLDKSTESAELTTKLSSLSEEASTTASDSIATENEIQTSVKPTDEFITEEQPLSTERQTERPSDDGLIFSSTDKTEEPTGGEEISVSSEPSEKPDTVTISTEIEIENETTEKLSTYLPSSTEKQTEFTEENSTPLSQTTAEKPESYETSEPKEHSVSSEESSSTMSALPEISISPESPKDETKYTTSPQPDKETTTIFGESSTSSATELERETTLTDESYSQKPTSKPLDSTSEETTLPSEHEPTSSDVTKIFDDLTTTQPSISVEDKTSDILAGMHTTQEPDKILDGSLATSEISLTTQSVTEAGSETGVSSTSVPDRSTEIPIEMTEDASSVAEKVTTVGIIENTSEPTEFSVEPTEEPVEKETEPTEQKTPEGTTLTPTEEETFKSTSYPVGEISSTSEVPVITITSEISALPEQETSTEQPSTEKESTTIKDEIYGTSSSETPEFPKEDMTTTAPFEEPAVGSTGPTMNITEEKEVSTEQTMVSSDEMSSSTLPDSTEKTEVITEVTGTTETSSKESELESHPVTSPKEEMLEPTTSKEQLEDLLPTTSKEPMEETSNEMPTETKLPDELPVEPEIPGPSTETPEVPKTTLSPEKEVSEVASSMEPEVTDKLTESEPVTKLPSISMESSSESSEEMTPEEEVPFEGHVPDVTAMPDEGEEGTLEPEEHVFNHTMETNHSSTTTPQSTESASDGPENPSFPMNGGSYLNPDEDYDEDDQAIYGPGTCRYGGKVYMSAQQIPRDDPCDFCFCFRSDIICLQQSCPPPIPGCHEEPINGFCCPRYECPVSMAATLNLTTTTTTTTTTLPPHFLTHAYKGAAKRSGCIVGGQVYRVGEVIKSASGPCLQCTCGGDGNMNCNPRVCTPEPSYRQMIAHATAKRRR